MHIAFNRIFGANTYAYLSNRYIITICVLKQMRTHSQITSIITIYCIKWNDTFCEYHTGFISMLVNDIKIVTTTENYDYDISKNP